MKLWIISLTLLFFMMFLLSMVNFLSFKTFSKSFNTKSSPFECGFDPLNNSRYPFSYRFFLLSVIFLIFDIEIILIFPLIMTKDSNTPLFTSIFFFFIILNFGLFHEWREGSLNWTN